MITLAINIYVLNDGILRHQNIQTWYDTIRVTGTMFLGLMFASILSMAAVEICKEFNEYMATESFSRATAALMWTVMGLLLSSVAIKPNDDAFVAASWFYFCDLSYLLSQHHVGIF